MVTCHMVVLVQVNVPKQRKTFCKTCKRHALFKVSQYKAGKASLYAQGGRGPALQCCGVWGTLALQCCGVLGTLTLQCCGV